MDWINAVGQLATAGALIAAIWQLRQGVIDARLRDRDRRVERALGYYESVVAEGETQRAFHRLSVALRLQGSKDHGMTTWHVVYDRDLEAEGFLDPTDAGKTQLFADTYAVLWLFERCELALHRQIVDRDMLMETLGFHFWWWSQMMRGLQSPKAAAAVHRLGTMARTWADDRGRLDEWHARCATDFEGAGPRYEDGVDEYSPQEELQASPQSR